MEIKKGKIVKATDSELYKYWLRQYSDIMSYTDYKNKMINLGVTIIEIKERESKKTCSI